MIQLNENHRSNTVCLNGIGRPIKNIHCCIQNCPATLLVGRMTFQIKPGKIQLAPMSFSHIITLQRYVSAKIDFYLQLFKKYSRRPHLQNKGNVTSKKIRPRQIETKSLMGKGESSSLLLSFQKSE